MVQSWSPAVAHNSKDGEKPCPILNPFYPPNSPECEWAYPSNAWGVFLLRERWHERGAERAQGSSGKAEGKVWCMLVHPGLDLSAAQSCLVLFLACNKMFQYWCRQWVWDESVLIYVLLTALSPRLLLSQEYQWMLSCLRVRGTMPECRSQNMYLKPSEHWRPSWLWGVDRPPSYSEDRWKPFLEKTVG